MARSVASLRFSMVRGGMEHLQELLDRPYGACGLSMELSIGDQSSIGEHAWIYCLDKITIGKNCCIGEDVRLLTGSHDVHVPTFDLVTKPISIKDDVWIATGAYVLPGVTIGEGSVVGAGSVVTKDVEPWTVVAGNPAKFIKRRELKD